MLIDRSVQILNVRGDKCPLPVLKCKKTLAQMNHGEVLCVEATDEESLKDIPYFCQQTGHVLLDKKEHYDGDKRIFVFYIKKV